MSDAAADTRPTRLAVPVTERDHACGPSDAAVTLVEYGDYECPDCFNALPVVRKVRQVMGDKLRFVFRNYPLQTIHAHASQAAQAAESAGAQGKFWEMHDLLYANQKNLANVDLRQYALRLGLEIYRFESDMSGEVFAKKVRDDFRGGEQSGVKGTPTFFINGERFKGEATDDSLLAAVRAVGDAGSGSVY